MEHEVHVPFPIGSVRAALAESERGIRCVPGLKLDAVEATTTSAATESLNVETESAEADELADAVRVRGRLRLRIAGVTITYRGSLRLAAEGQGFTVEAEGVEARGGGSAQLLLTIVPRHSYAETSHDGSTPPRAIGTILAISGTCGGRGRLAEVPEEQMEATGRRLIDRFGAALGESLAVEPPGDDNARAIPGIPAPEDGSSATTVGGAAVDAADGGDGGDVPEPPEAVQDERSGLSVFETEIPPPSLDSAGEEPRQPAAEIPAPGLPPAEAAHARRTMIGRSAEEVDHAPPRGRYAPVPPPAPASTGATLRWAAPAAAVVLASAVVFSRVLRRRGR